MEIIIRKKVKPTGKENDKLILFLKNCTKKVVGILISTPVFTLLTVSTWRNEKRNSETCKFKRRTLLSQKEKQCSSKKKLSIKFKYTTRFIICGINEITRWKVFYWVKIKF